MKLKFKLSRKQLIAAGIAVLAVFALLVSRGGGGSDEQQQAGPLDAAAAEACGTFADGHRQARSKTARLALSDDVANAAGRTDNDEILTRARAVGRDADGTDAEWRSSSDALTAACRDAGWSPA